MRWPAASPGPSWVAGAGAARGSSWLRDPRGCVAQREGRPRAAPPYSPSGPQNSRPAPDHPPAGAAAASAPTAAFPFIDAAAQRAGPAGRCGTSRGTSLGCNKSGPPVGDSSGWGTMAARGARLGEPAAPRSIPPRGSAARRLPVRPNDMGEQQPAGWCGTGRGTSRGSYCCGSGRIVFVRNWIGRLRGLERRLRGHGCPGWVVERLLNPAPKPSRRRWGTPTFWPQCTVCALGLPGA